MRLQLRAAACILAGFFASRAPAAPPLTAEPDFATEEFGLESGLPSNVTSAFLQSRDGYLWIGTEDGLARYDGAKFEVFRASESGGLPDNLVRCLVEDSSGSVLIGTQQGLARYRNGKIERIGGPSIRVADMALDSDNRVWIATLGAGLLDYRFGRLTSHAADPQFAGLPDITRLYSDSSGHLWIARQHGGVYFFENGICREFDRIGREMGEVARIYESPRGTLWFATAKTLLKLKDGQLRPVGLADGLGNEDVTGFTTDLSGRLWIAARGMYRAVDAQASAFVEVPRPPDAVCRVLLADREGSIWAGAVGRGVLQLRETAFRVWSALPAGVPQNGVRSVAQSADGSIWAALVTYGANRIFPDGRLASIQLGLGRDRDVWSVTAGADDRLWIGTRGALYAWKDGRLERFPDYTNTMVLYKDHSGAVWISSTEKGIVRWKDGRFQAMGEALGTALTEAKCFGEDPGGTLYVGMDAGLVKYAGGKATRCDPGDTISGFGIRSVYADAEGDVWVGTKRRGLVLLHEGRWFEPKSLSEPFGDLVTAIVEDTRGNLWLGTAKGIVWAPKKSLRSTAFGESKADIHWAGKDEGVQAGTVGYGSQPLAVVAADKRIWFATQKGLVQVNPENIPFNTTPPLVEIEKVTVDGNEVELTDEIRLSPGTRSLAIDYAASSFVRPQSIAFRYKLEGHEDKWIEAGPRRTAYYTILRPGSYRFRVLACNCDGVWSDTGAVLGLVQKPWFYETWWFYVSAAAAAALLALAIFRLRTSALRRENERLERGIAERTRELVQARKMEAVGQLAGGVAHDFNNILTAILMQLGLLMGETDLDPDAKSGLQDLEKQARRAASLTRQLLAFSRRQVMRSRAFDINAMLDELFKMLRRLLGENIGLEFKGGQPLWIEGDVAMIEQVVTNLCLNARDAMTPKGGLLLIETRLRTLTESDARANPEARPGSFVCLSVTDTGCGMDEGVLQHIFEPFFTTKEVNKGTGLGLATVYGIVKQHHGWVEVASRVGSGSTFSVFLPSRVAPDAAEPGPLVEHAYGGKETILLVEDERTVRTMASRCLQKFGYRVLEAADGREAISTWEQHGPGIDLLFSDMVMPNGITGLELAERFKVTKPGLKVIVTSGYSVDLRKAGVSGESNFVYLAKPYEMKNLVAAVRKCLDGATGS
jgi:signal transduction histidine kinase/ligand-binding sensor domain-containing protein/ActR/RegA family two-component response regulator